MTDHDDSALIAPAIQEQLQLGAAARIELPRVREQLAEAYAAAARSATERDEARATAEAMTQSVKRLVPERDRLLEANKTIIGENHNVREQLDRANTERQRLAQELATMTAVARSNKQHVAGLAAIVGDIEQLATLWSTATGDGAGSTTRRAAGEDLFRVLNAPASPVRPGSSRPAQEPVAGRPTAEQVAKLFHDAYEQLAPKHGYQTRQASAKPWTEVPPQNRGLMVATCARVLLELFGPATGGPVEPGSVVLAGESRAGWLMPSPSTLATLTDVQTLIADAVQQMRDLIVERPRLEAGGIGFQAERADLPTYGDDAPGTLRSRP